MRAVDTNVIVRYLTWDDPMLSPKAAQVIEQQDVFVSKTVMLETEWVLRSLYGYPRARIVEALAALAGLPNVVFESAGQARLAISWAESGMEFADALHLASAEACETFVSEDRALARLAGRLDAMKVERL